MSGIPTRSFSTYMSEALTLLNALENTFQLECVLSLQHNYKHCLALEMYLNTIIKMPSAVTNSMNMYLHTPSKAIIKFSYTWTAIRQIATSA